MQIVTEPANNIITSMAGKKKYYKLDVIGIIGTRDDKYETERWTEMERTSAYISDAKSNKVNHFEKRKSKVKVKYIKLSFRGYCKGGFFIEI